MKTLDRLTYKIHQHCSFFIRKEDAAIPFHEKAPRDRAISGGRSFAMMLGTSLEFITSLALAVLSSIPVILTCGKARSLRNFAGAFVKNANVNFCLSCAYFVVLKGKIFKPRFACE